MRKKKEIMRGMKEERGKHGSSGEMWKKIEGEKR